ncbi:MAG TPA: hypothetical protein VJ833_13755 [Rhodanobacteraceae bacterium]|nr:hypothetical protein [Rhodanobacteraceae bacterium]
MNEVPNDDARGKDPAIMAESVALASAVQFLRGIFDDAAHSLSTAIRRDGSHRQLKNRCKPVATGSAELPI